MEVLLRGSARGDSGSRSFESTLKAIRARASIVRRTAIVDRTAPHLAAISEMSNSALFARCSGVASGRLPRKSPSHGHTSSGLDPMRWKHHFLPNPWLLFKTIPSVCGSHRGTCSVIRSPASFFFPNRKPGFLIDLTHADGGTGERITV